MPTPHLLCGLDLHRLQSAQSSAADQTNSFEAIKDKWKAGHTDTLTPALTGQDAVTLATRCSPKNHLWVLIVCTYPCSAVVSLNFHFYNLVSQCLAAKAATFPQPVTIILVN